MRNWSKISNFDLTMRSHHRSKLPGIQNENELVSANFSDLKFCIKLHSSMCLKDPLHQSALAIQTVVGQAPFISLLFLSFLKCNIFVKLHLLYSSNLKITMSIYPFISPLCVHFSYKRGLLLPMDLI